MHRLLSMMLWLRLEKTVGERKVLCALSGGVDSSVVAVLIHRAIGDQLTCVFVDHGSVAKGRGGECDELLFADHFHMTVIKVDAARAVSGEIKRHFRPRTETKND